MKKIHRLFFSFVRCVYKKMRAFTLIELLVVLGVIGILASITVSALLSAREAARLARAKGEMHAFANALELYANDHGAYPVDANRNIPPGLEPYLSSGNWPQSPWSGGVYDWDNWSPVALSFEPKQQVYQISVRFCTSSDPDTCRFPDEPWAADFDYYSAAYYCISGPCRSHSSKPVDHPGYCINC